MAPGWEHEVVSDLYKHNKLMMAISPNFDFK